MGTLPHEHVYARLGSSPIHGVGAFALRPIPAGTVIFRDDDDMVWIDRAEIDELPEAIRRLYVHYGLWRGDRVGCPRSFNKLTPAWFVNHGEDAPNLRLNEDDFQFYAARDIAVGEELTVNYRLYSDAVNLRA